MASSNIEPPPLPGYPRDLLLDYLAIRRLAQSYRLDILATTAPAVSCGVCHSSRTAADRREHGPYCGKLNRLIVPSPEKLIEPPPKSLDRFTDSVNASGFIGSRAGS